MAFNVQKIEINVTKSILFENDIKHFNFHKLSIDQHFAQHLFVCFSFKFFIQICI